MNRPIVRLFGLVVAMFALLLAFTSRWTVFEASSLRANVLNKRPLLEQRRIDRGSIVAANGTVLARSVLGGHARGSEAFYERVYPAGEEFAHAVGYWNIDYGSTGLERFRNAASDLGLEAVTVALPNLADDVDTEADLDRVAGRTGPRTRTVLAENGVRT